jgi:hypothetical protein
LLEGVEEENAEVADEERRKISLKRKRGVLIAKISRKDSDSQPSSRPSGETRFRP